MAKPIFEYQFPVILLGNSTAGKSLLPKYFTEGEFDEGCELTVAKPIHSLGYLWSPSFGEFDEVLPAMPAGPESCHFV